MTIFRPMARAAVGIVFASGAALAEPLDASDGAEPPMLTEVQVTAHKLDVARNELMPEIGASEFHFSASDLGNLPLGDNTPLNQVLLRAPGVAQDSFGQLHVRGDHANLQYRINDVVIPESISLFGQALTPRFASEINLLTGALPAQYGYRTAGVVDIHTKGSDYRQGGELSLLGGSRQHYQVDGEASGVAGALSFYATAGYLENNLGIENPMPTADALHDHTEQWHGFGYLAYVFGDESRLSLLLDESNNTFEIPNIAGLSPTYTPPGVTIPASADIDANQHEGNRFAILAYENAVTATLHYQVALYDRNSDVHYRPDPVGDLNYTGAAGDIQRSNQNWGLQADASLKRSGAHTLRFGAVYSDEQASSRTSTTVYPLDPQGEVIYTPLTIADDRSDTARLFGVYAQDEWRPLQPLTINYGLRYDRYEGLISEDQLSPRVGVVWDFGGGKTLHAGYARYFTPPPTEKIRVETIALYENTTGAPKSTGNDPPRSERSNYYDIGILGPVSPTLTLGLDAYYRDVSELGDEGQFGSALIFAPFNYERGRIYGAEFTSAWRVGATNTYFNAAYGLAEGRNIVSGQYNFAPDELAAIAAQYIHLDHDQRWSASAGASRTVQGTTLSLDAVFGSGLRRGYLNSDHLPSYLTFSLGARHRFDVAHFGALEASFSVVNVLDRVYELRDGSGVGVGAPQWGMRRTFYIGLGKPFGA